MADVEITCPKCSKIRTVSEFVDSANLKCQACGEPLAKPEPTKQNSRPSAMRIVTTESVQEVQQTADDESPGNWQITQQAARDKRPKQKFHMTPLLWGSITFLIVGGTMGYLRYFGGFLSENIEMISTYGPIIVITLHVIIVLKAYKDSVFQGVLCTLVPLYSFYYLFLVCDDFLLRGITGGLLIGIGQESFMFFSEYTSSIMKSVTGWISRGGD